MAEVCAKMQMHATHGGAPDSGCLEQGGTEAPDFSTVSSRALGGMAYHSCQYMSSVQSTTIIVPRTVSIFVLHVSHYLCHSIASPILRSMACDLLHTPHAI